ncbi:hypervirulence associated TUDOR domain-containing protein [Larkinella soli]|uniref:DUF2945 domain-containing protein n=1 Tax=Larkinella soli TaxID=1770527 RepID=UPI0019D1A778|nr:DUF2945 domain-containing protein [Larkinella soli]
MIKKGATVRWKYGKGHAEGKVVEVHREEVEKTIEGKKIKRNGTDDNPALVIEQDDKQVVLKLESEVEEK